MAKTTKFGGGKVRTKNLGGAKVKRPELRLDVAPTNEAADKTAQLIYIGLSVFSVVLIGLLLWWAISSLVGGITGGHLAWGAIIGGAVGIGACIFFGRTLAWLSYFGAIMYSMKTHAWVSQERLCRSALKKWRIFPGGAATAALMLVQSLVSRGQFDDAIAIGEEQYKLHGNDPKFNESFAPMYTALGMAFQVKGELKESITWTDRGIQALERALSQLLEKKTWQAKMAGVQGIEWAKQLRMQLCIAHFNNATSYFNQQNYRQAKQLYKEALDYANLAPDFPEKGDVVRVSREQLSRLKHT